MVKLFIMYAIVLLEAATVILSIVGNSTPTFYTKLGTSMIVSLFTLLSFNLIVFNLTLKKLYGGMILVAMFLFLPATAVFLKSTGY